MPNPPQAVAAALPRVPSLDGLPAMCGAEDAALRHPAAAELLSAGEAALGAALHNSLSADSLAASAGAAREGSHDSSNTAGGAAGGLTGALLVRPRIAIKVLQALSQALSCMGASCGGSDGASSDAGDPRLYQHNGEGQSPLLCIADALAWKRHLRSRTACSSGFDPPTAALPISCSGEFIHATRENSVAYYLCRNRAAWQAGRARRRGRGRCQGSARRGGPERSCVGVSASADHASPGASTGHASAALRCSARRYECLWFQVHAAQLHSAQRLRQAHGRARKQAIGHGRFSCTRGS